MIDLHSHSTVSDGTDPPAAIIAMAVDRALTAIALTDHDTLEHIAPARAAADELEIRLVPATEISCALDGRAPGTLHLLVYFLDDPDSPLGARLGALQTARQSRNVLIVEALRDNGVDITLDEVLAKGGTGTVGRPHIAQVLMDKGAVSSIQEAFDVWLAKGRPGYHERERLGPEVATGLAHESGAVTVVAHPLSLGLDTTELDRFVAELAEAGLDGLECEYGRYTPEERGALSALAARHGLAPTGGSDYHGDNKPDLQIGIGQGDLAVPDDLLENLESRHRVP
ncbi:MAG TPA: PHP domain-containing protein [Acidimicrobiia bacterium]